MGGYKDIWEFLISHRRFTAIILAAIVILGFFSMVILPKESNPEVNIPVGVVTTFFPGASATDVEELVTDVIEDKVLSLDEVTVVTSTSRESVSSVVVEFDPSADSDKKIQDLKEKVDEAEVDLPDEAEEPVVQKVRFEDAPFFVFSLGGPYDVAQLKYFAEILEDEIERISGVSKVEVTGGQEREFQVVVDKKKLDLFGLSIGEVTSAISRANADIPTGSIETAGSQYNIRLAGRIFTREDVESVPVAQRGGAPVYVNDVATVIDGFSERSTISRLSIDAEPSLPSVTLSVFKSTGGDIVRITDAAQEEIEAAKNTFLPDNVIIEEVQNDAKFIREDITNLSISGVQTIIIVTLLLLLFLGWREALLAGVAIPLSFLITFIGLTAVGSSINFLSLFSLILALGILIDGAVVITEGMYQNINKGMSGYKAAIATVRDFKLPLISGTLTTVFAFVPMLLMGGILGEFVKHIPITVTIVLVSSLFVALGLITSLGVGFLKSKKEEKEVRYLSTVLSYTSSLFVSLRKWYEERLRALLSEKRLQKRLKWALTAAFVFSLSLPVVGALPVNMFPPDDFELVFIDLELPVGTPLEETDRQIQKVEELLLGDDRIKSFAVTTGAASVFSEKGNAEHFANILINLADERDESSLDIVDQYQSLYNTELSDLRVNVSQPNGGPPTGAPVEIVITGRELETLEDLAREYENLLNDIPGTRNVNSTVQDAIGEFEIELDRAKAQLYGVSTIEVAQVLRNAVSGTDATVIRKSGEEIDVLVKLDLGDNREETGKTNITDINSIKSLTVATRGGALSLGTIADIKLTGGRPDIQHKNGRRTVRVTSYTSQGTEAAQIFAKVAEAQDTITVPEGYFVSLGGEREDIQESYNDMFRAMILAVFLIASAMVLQFNSFRQPVFILMTIPLAFIGVFPGLVLVGKPLSFPGIIGVVALTGIVVNNAIILIDKINKNREVGKMTKLEAVVEAGTSRLRPVVLTTITTIVGIFPITLSNELWGPLGYAIIFGLLFSTVLTLFVIPMLYNRFGRKGEYDAPVG